MTRIVTASDNEAVPPGTYDGELAEITDSDGKFGPCWDWTFAVTGPDGPAEVSRRTSTKLNSQSIAGEFVEALLGRKIQPREEVDLDDLIGRHATLTIETSEKGFSNIMDIRSARPDAPKVAA